MEYPKILFVGLGEHARRGHLNHLVNLDVYPLIGVADPAFTEAHETESLPNGKRLKAMPFGDKALEWADAVLICSPDAFHLPQMTRAISAGCHVFCEKPLASSPHDIADLQELFDVAEGKNLTITSCHPRRFDPPYIGMQRTLPVFHDSYGALLEVRLDFSYHKPSKTGLHGGSLLQDHANHELDYFCWLTGKTSAADFRIVHKLVDDETRYHLAGVCTDGTVFNFSGTRRLEQGTYPESIFLRFERGEVSIDTYNAKNSYHLHHGTRNRYDYPLPVTDYEVRFKRMNIHWLNLIAGTEPNYLTAEQMLLNTAISVGLNIGGSVCAIAA